MDEFSNIHIVGGEVNSDLALTLLFQLLEYWKEYYPKETEEIEQCNKGFQERYTLMSLSSQILAKLEKLQIYLEKEFKEFEWKPLTLGNKKKNKDITIKMLSYLDMLANYLMIIVEENSHQTPIFSGNNPVQKYYQNHIINERIRYLKSKMVGLSNYYKQYIVIKSIIIH